MTTWVVDSSVAVKWFILEDHSLIASSLLDSSHELFAPSLLLIEFDNVMATHLRRGKLEPAEARRICAALRRMSVQFHDFVALLEPAFELAARTRQTIYDCCFLALAATLDVRLLTDDRRFLRSLPADLRNRVSWIGDLLSA